MKTKRAGDDASSLFFTFFRPWEPLWRREVLPDRSGRAYKYKFYQEKIRGQRGTIGALSGICLFHLNYF